MSMEQRLTTLEEVSARVIAALRASNAARERLSQGAAMRDQAMLELNAAVERSAESIRRMQLSISSLEDTVASLQVTMSGLEQSRQEIDEASARSEEAVNSLLAYLPITQAEIVRLTPGSIP